MAIHYAVVGLRPLITGVVPSVIEFPAPRDCRLNRIFARISAANSAGDVILDVNVNGATIYASPADQPRITAGQTRVNAFPVVDLLEGDMVTVDADAIPLGGVSGLYIIVQLQDAPTEAQYVKDLYQGILLRQPTSGELSAAIAVLDASTSDTILTSTRTLQDTVVAGLGVITDDQYIERLYNGVLGRLSDHGGFSFWHARMAIDGMTRSQVLGYFNLSIEHQNLRVQPWYPQMSLVSSANKIQGRDVLNTAPSVNQAILWNGTAWAPASLDFVLNSLDFKQSVRAATTGALPAYTHSGVALTATSNGALAAQDGVTLVATDRLLVKNESGGNQKYNGIYAVTQVGDGSHPFILTRATDADASAEVTAGMATGVAEGTTLADTLWWLTTNDPIVLDTDALTFSQFGSGVNPDNSTLELASGILRVKDAGITYAKMQNVSAASKLLGRGDSGSGSPQEITLGTGLSMAGTTLSASGGGGGGSGSTIDTLFTNMSNQTVPGSSTRYTTFGVISFGTDENVFNFYMPKNGNLTRISVHMHTAQPSSGSLVITVRKGGVNTSLAITIPSSGGASGYDATGTVAVLAGEYISIGFVNNATAASGGIASVAVVFEPTGSSASVGGVQPVGNLKFYTHLRNSPAGGWNGITVFDIIEGDRLVTLTNSWKISVEIGTAGMACDSIKLLRTTRGSTTVVDSTPITFGGSATPTLPVGVSESDAIGVLLDNDHDYWVALHFAAGASATGTLVAPTLTKGGAGNADWDLAATPRWITGDHTADSTIPAGTGLAYHLVSRVRAGNPAIGGGLISVVSPGTSFSYTQINTPSTVTDLSGAINIKASTSVNPCGLVLAYGGGNFDAAVGFLPTGRRCVSAPPRPMLGGIMVRDSATGNTAVAGLATYNDLFQYAFLTYTSGFNNTQIVGISDLEFGPLKAYGNWVRLTRVGTTWTLYVSGDGGQNWYSIGTQTDANVLAVVASPNQIGFGIGAGSGGTSTFFSATWFHFVKTGF